MLAMPLMAQDGNRRPQRNNQQNNQPNAEQKAQRIDAAMEKFDQDGDKVLNADEFAALLRHVNKMMKEHRGPNPEILEMYDLDKDGELSKEEREAMKADAPQKEKREPLTDEQKEARSEKQQAHRAEQLAQFDNNEDGFIDKKELAEAAKKVAAHRKNEGEAHQAQDKPQKGDKKGHKNEPKKSKD